MRYKVVKGTFYDYSARHTSFQLLIDEALDSGWIPQGGICVDGNNIYQAFIKKSKEDIDNG